MNWCLLFVSALVTTAWRAVSAALPSGQPAPATGAPPEEEGP